MKLYWRYKKDGKWTWKAVRIHEVHAEGETFLDLLIAKESDVAENLELVDFIKRGEEE